MKPTIKKYFGLYNTDDRGYVVDDDPIDIAPFAGALKSKEKCGEYTVVHPIQILQFEDVNYEMEDSPFDETSVIGKFKPFVPIDAFFIYIYKDGFDKSFYIVGETELIKYINSVNSVSNIRKSVLIKDNEGNVYKLKNKNTVVIKPFTMSREMAITNALEKLTDEDKKLLGLI
jgi:hypothetical protein